MRPDDVVRIRHMIEAADAAASFIGDRGQAELESDLMLLFALVRAVEIVGEAAARVSPETRTRCPEVPWSAIVAMRNRLVHAYFDIDRRILWRTVTDELPRLRRELGRLLSGGLGPSSVAPGT